jgi:predicted nucleotidyltransferase
MNKEDILNKLRDIKPKLNQDGIEKIGIFGSYAKDTYTNQSDIDIVYKSTDKFLNKFEGWTAFTYLNQNIREKISNEFNVRVDIFDLNSDSILKDKIDKEAIYV